MNELKLQQQIVEELNASECLAKGGAKAFIENRLDLVDVVSDHLLKGVALVVVTPDLTRNGCDERGIPAAGAVLVQCEEIRTHNQQTSGNFTALDAAGIVRHILERPGFQWRSSAQRVDAAAGRIIVTVTFDTSILLTQNN